MKAKICGLTRPEDVAHAADLGADYLGFILVPGTPRYRTPSEIRALGASARGVSRVGVFPAGPVSSIVTDASGAALDVIQLHGSFSPDAVEALRSAGSWELWKVLRVRGDEDLLDAVAPWVGAVDLVLLDTWHPVHLGGSGVRFSWDGLEAARAHWPDSLRLGIAGGLSPESVGEARARLWPDLVDVSSGVEAAPGQKDPRLVAEFLARAGRRRRVSDDSTG
jgi:phosphoribosylanthranilate isomerase